MRQNIQNDSIKIDAEGYELEIFKGAKKIFKKKIF
tara:strand:- start:43 stop:147 length:105 start_codon:yes stop_codon:yes gene_type:complete